MRRNYMDYKLEPKSKTHMNREIELDNMIRDETWDRVLFISGVAIGISWLFVLAENFL